MNYYHTATDHRLPPPLAERKDDYRLANATAKLKAVL
jgi:hypothetical protein